QERVPSRRDQDAQQVGDADLPGMARDGERADMSRRLQLAGRCFGRLTVLSFSHLDHRRSAWFTCRCSCGTEKQIRGASLVMKGGTRSCGCISREMLTSRATHGHARNGEMTAEYKAWQSMLRRCENSTSQHYHRCGGRGIKVCERWHKFES